MPIDYQEFFLDLPNDPYMGSYELLTRINKHILSSHPSETEYNDACGILQAFYEANNFTVPDPISVSRGFGVITGATAGETAAQAIERAREYARLQFEAFRHEILANRRHAINHAAKESISAITAATFGYATLNENEKTEIHKHIEKIRKIIERSSLEDRKKNSLFDRLSDLSSDVDRNGTRTDRFFAFASEVGFCIGGFAKNAKPLIDEIKEVLKIVCRARSRNEGTQLPPGDTVLSLPEPNENINGIL